MSKFRANEIIPGLFLGNYEDAKSSYHGKRGHVIVCMHENLPTNTPNQKWFPLHPDAYSCDFEMLERACDFIDYCMLKKQPVLVHCHAGVERSPLTVAWYLYTRGHFQTIHAAYEYIQRKRPIVEDRICWLPEAVRLKMVGVTGAEPSNNQDA